ncbi:hypothetical protein BKA58DRAFT_396566 [Alternaria rosae]|uniref:uncharacterized protein n=1 Tax=Alternaria rosae TaxID=1187941 RepID=UPI001E8DE685|nr:uncharacterized protein BKA58DRAFT_396566 [Alternaria rosae]KAH6882263.1 hypothetical protein BKA58DRAFT_396566 [Alternaria rosae]
MNALDFLVDFAASVSTSEASRPGSDGGNVNHKIDTTRMKVQSASEMCIPISEESFPVDGRRPVETIQLQSSMAPSSSQQTFPAHMVDHPSLTAHCHNTYEGSFAISPEPHMIPSFDQFLYEHARLGLPRVTPTELGYYDCDCERLHDWGLGYETSYSLPVEPTSWLHVQPQYHLPNHDARYLETHYTLLAQEVSTQPSQCIAATCHYEHPQPHNHVVGNIRAFATHIWGPHASVHDKNISKDDDEWLWVSAGRDHEMSRI